MPSAGPTQPVLSSINSSQPTPNYQGVLDKKHWHKVEFAFTSGGVNYFCWNHDIQIPIERMVAAKEVYHEAEWRLTPALVQKAFSEINQILFSTKYKDEGKRKEEISRISVLVLERMNLAFHPSMELKFSSVVYFDEVENPFTYDYPYATKKIEHWLKNMDVPAFFLQTSEAKLIPGGAELQKISQDFLKSLSMETTLNVALMEMLDTTEKESSDSAKDLRKILALQKQMELTLKNLATGLHGSSIS